MNKNIQKNSEKKYGYDLWKTLDAINNGTFDYLDQISEEEKNKILQSLFIIQRWISCPKNQTKETYIWHLLALNRIVNQNFLSLFENYSFEENHRKLIWKLFCLMGEKKRRYEWIPLIKKKKEDKAKILFPNLNDDEISLILSNNNILKKIENYFEE